MSPSATAKGQVIYGNNNWSTTIQGVNNFYPLDTIRQWSLTAGNEFTDKDIASEAKVCLLGQTVADQSFYQWRKSGGQVYSFPADTIYGHWCLSQKEPTPLGRVRMILLLRLILRFRKEFYLPSPPKVFMHQRKMNHLPFELQRKYRRFCRFHTGLNQQTTTILP